MTSEFSRRRFIATAALSTGAVLLTQDQSWSHTESRRIRREIRSLSASELEKLRNAFRELQNKSGADGYQKIAGNHGEPDNYCHNDETIFLPWHRAYIQRFEDALRTIDSSVTLPFWDWTSTDSTTNGIPKAISDATYASGGMTLPNPLFSAKIDHSGHPTGATRRNPRQPIALGSLATQVTACFAETNFASFNSELNFPHGGLHTWVRGDMGSVAYAAYDPIFWLHHANVDRQWAQWQAGENNAPPLSDIMDKDLEPFGMKTSGVVDYKTQLNFEYEGLLPMPPQHFLLAERENLFRVEEFTFDAKRQAAFLMVHDLKPASTSYNVDVFINQPDADEKTPLEGNSNYAGSFGIFGGGKHAAHADHADPKKSQRVLNISKAIARLTKAGEKTNLRVKLVITDLDGKPIDVARLPLKGISIRFD